MRQDPDEPRRDEPSFAWPPLPPRARRRRGRGGTVLVLTVALVTAAIGAGAAVVLERNSSGTPSAETGLTQLDPPLVTREVDPGVVDIVARDGYSGLVAEGTGMILSAGGLILTNNHVIDGSTTVTVTLVSSGRTYPARVVGYDSAADVALLRLTGAAGLHAIVAGNSSRVQVGQPVLAFGNAQGLGGPPAATAGAVTALDQTISPTNSATGATETLRDTIETSARIAEGESGGPLADAEGHVIGMVTAQASGPPASGAASGYAIPVNEALLIARSIASGQASGAVHIGLPAFIGVEVIDASSSCGELALGTSRHTPAVGAKICTVYQGTPASRADLTPGDVITSAGGQPVGSSSALTAVTARLRPGTVLPVLYIDAKGTAHTVRITLVTGPAA